MATWRVLASDRVSWKGSNIGLIEADTVIITASGALCFQGSDTELLEAFAPGVWLHVQRKEKDPQNTINESGGDNEKA